MIRSAATSFTPLWDRGAEWAARLAMVREARSFLVLSTYYVEQDDHGREMLDALLEARRRGVLVELIIDAYGQRLGGVLMSRADRAALHASLSTLREAGAGVRLYRPPRLMQRLLAGGHHVKIQVSEAGEAILGSGNITHASFVAWNDYAMAVRGPVVAVLLESCRHIGGVVPDTALAHLRASPTGSDDLLPLDYWFFNPNHHQGLWGALGWRGPNTLTERMVEMVDSAQRSLRITSFYFKPTPRLLAAVLRAAARGVEVEVFHSHPDALPATDLAWVAAAAGYDVLLAAGAHIYENRRGEHSKIVLVDDVWAAAGSYNFEDAAHDRLAEAMLASRDERFVAPKRRIFEGLRRAPENERVTQESVAAWADRVRRRVRRYGRFRRWL